MSKTIKKPWPAIKSGSSPFARDINFLSPAARGFERQRRTDAEVTAFQTKGHGGIDLCLPGASRFLKAKGEAV